MKSKSYYQNSNINDKVNIDNRINNEIFQIDKLTSTNLNQTEIKCLSDYYNIYNIVDKEISFIKQI